MLSSALLYTPACLVANTDQAAFDGLTAQVYGFGSVGDTSDVGVLHEVNVTLVPNSYCGEVNDGPVSAGKLCAGNVTHLDTGACQVNIRLLKLAVKITIFQYLMFQWDTGGPLTYQSKGQSILMGVVTENNCGKVQ